MKTIKVLGLICVFQLLFSGCGSGKNLSDTQDLDTPFKLVSATYTTNEKIPGSITVSIVIDNNDVILKELYFKSRISHLKKETGETGETGVYYTLIKTENENRDLILHADRTREFGNTVSIKEKLPFNLKGNEAIISYNYKGDLKYFHIPQIKPY